MRHELPNKPNLEHLKKQAKDLLELHRQQDTAALRRIREGLPALAGASDERIAKGPFALHDAQSVIAREYGFASWTELKAHVTSAEQEDATLALLQKLLPFPLPEEVGGALKETMRAGDLDSAGITVPRRLPLLAVRNALIGAGSTAPIHLARPRSIAAVRAAEAMEPRLVAVFAQRVPDVLEPTAADLHDTGCAALIARVLPAKEEGQLWVVLRGIRWIRLDALDSAGGYSVAQVSAQDVAAEDTPAVRALADQLRRRAAYFARTLSASLDAAGLLAQAKDPRQVVDLVMNNLPCSVEDKARFAAETNLQARLEHALQLLDSHTARVTP
jgi:Lon protease-like protein